MRRTPMPVKIALAGENTYNIWIRKSFKLALFMRHTRLTPPETAAENANRTFTVGPSHLVNLSSPP
jgi:hypothetical protein